MDETKQSYRKSEIIETEHGDFELIKDFRECFDTKTFTERYVDYLDRYDYIVGDISSDMLRLKGFSSKNKDNIFDYLMESANPHAPYFILKRIRKEGEGKNKNNKKKKSGKKKEASSNQPKD